jgi:hypothetical protein
MSWEAELQRKWRKILKGLDKYVENRRHCQCQTVVTEGTASLLAYCHFKFFENVQFGILISQHHIPGTASGHGSDNKFEDLCCAELVNYILEPIRKKCTDIIFSC